MTKEQLKGEEYTSCDWCSIEIYEGDECLLTTSDEVYCTDCMDEDYVKKWVIDAAGDEIIGAAKAI